jgi:2'-5' RNA ligase
MKFSHDADARQGLCLIFIFLGCFMTAARPSKLAVGGQTFRVFDPAGSSNEKGECAASSLIGGSKKKNDAQKRMIEKKAFTHFLSIPVNLDDVLTSAYEDIQQKHPSIRKSLFMPHRKLHLTLQMLTVPKENKASFMRSLRAVVNRLKTELPDQVVLDGLDILRGTKTEAEVVYFRVKNEAEWVAFVQLLQQNLLQEGLIDSSLVNLNDLIRIHCTLLNRKYGHVPSFDASSLFEKPIRVFKEIKTRQLHLSRLHGGVDLKTSYYGSEWIEAVG